MGATGWSKEKGRSGCVGFSETLYLWHPTAAALCMHASVLDLLQEEGAAHVGSRSHATGNVAIDHTRQVWRKDDAVTIRLAGNGAKDEGDAKFVELVHWTEALAPFPEDTRTSVAVVEEQADPREVVSGKFEEHASPFCLPPMFFIEEQHAVRVGRATSGGTGAWGVPSGVIAALCGFVDGIGEPLRLPPRSSGARGALRDGGWIEHRRWYHGTRWPRDWGSAPFPGRLATAAYVHWVSVREAWRPARKPARARLVRPGQHPLDALGGAFDAGRNHTAGSEEAQKRRGGGDRAPARRRTEPVGSHLQERRNRRHGEPESAGRRCPRALGKKGCGIAPVHPPGPDHQAVHMHEVIVEALEPLVGLASGDERPAAHCHFP